MSAAGTHWHGGGRIDGDYVLPPDTTGVVRSEPSGWVYITPTRGLALTYASTCDDPWLFEVEPIGHVEQDPNSKLPAGQSLRCEAARIVRRFKPSRREVEERRRIVRAAALLPGSVLADMLDQEAGR